MFVSDLSIKRPILVAMVLIVFLIFGGIAWFNLSLDLIPRTDLGIVTIQTVYPGAGPGEVESQVTKRIEDSISTIGRIDYMTSWSMDSVSIIIIFFKQDKDVNVAIREIKDKVDSIVNTLPENAEIPTVDKKDPNAEPVMQLMLAGDRNLVELTEIAERELKDKLSRIPDVANVNIIGGRDREIRVEFDNRLVFEQKISLAQLSRYLAAQNLNLPAGQFQNRDRDYSVRYQGEFSGVQALKNLDVPTAAGMKKLGEISSVSDTGADIRERAVFFDRVKNRRNENIVLLNVIKSSDGNAVKLAEALTRELPEIEKELPRGLELSVVRDESDFISGAVLDTMSTIMLGVLLTALILFFFLHDIRSVIIASLSMPFSIISTFLLMQAADFTLNLMSLMGISTAVGVLVTNSVVVLENIFRHKQEGMSNKEAAGKGTSEVVLAVLASTLTNIMVFLPIATMSGMVGQLFTQFGLTVTFATLFSLLASFTITPMLASLILKEKSDKKHPIGERIEKMFTAMETRYTRWLSVILRNKKRSLLTVLTALVVFVISFIPAGNIGFEFIPYMDNGEINVTAELQEGSSLDHTLKTTELIEKRLHGFPEVLHIVTQAGRMSDMEIGVNLAVLNIKLTDASERKKGTLDMINEFNKVLSDIPGVRIQVTESSRLTAGLAPVQFYLKGYDDKELDKLTGQILERIETLPGLVNFTSSRSTGNPELVLIPKHKKMAELGITNYDIAITLRGAVDGITPTQYKEKGEEYDIRLVLKDRAVNTPEKVGALTVLSSATGVSYRLDQLTDITLTKSSSKIQHRDKIKAIEFKANVAQGFVLGNVVDSVNNELDKITLPSGYSIAWGGETKLMNEAIGNMLFAFVLSIILTYMLLAAILESLTQPLMILATVPMALIGVFIFMPVFNMNMNIMSMMAVIMLIGIVVNNGILLLDYTNILRKRGKTINEALIESGRVKLKPILMTTIAIMLGMMPMALGVGEFASEVRQPMGLVSIGGLFASGFLTLLVLPAMYKLFALRKRKKEVQ